MLEILNILNENSPVRQQPKAQSIGFNALLIAIIITCPIVGLAIMCSRRKDWISNQNVSIGLTVWLTVWFLLLASAILPTYTNNQISNNELDSYVRGWGREYVIRDGCGEDITLIDNVKPKAYVEREKINCDFFWQELAQKEKAKKESKKEAAKVNQEKNNSNGDSSSTIPQAEVSTATPTANNTMAGIAIAEAANVPYDRTKYQPNWSVGVGCDIRSRVLSSASTVSVTYGSNGCTVKRGSWNDPYTGKTLAGNPYRGDGTANDLDIDHIIPLNYVNSHGGYYWADTQKRAYGASLAAMNNGVYLAVSASENRKKGDKGPSAYYPPNPAYKCEYSKKWRDIARAYAISLSSADYNLIASVLVSCGMN